MILGFYSILSFSPALLVIHFELTSSDWFPSRSFPRSSPSDSHPLSPFPAPVWVSSHPLAPSCTRSSMSPFSSHPRSLSPTLLCTPCTSPTDFGQSQPFSATLSAYLLSPPLSQPSLHPAWHSISGVSSLHSTAAAIRPVPRWEHYVHTPPGLLWMCVPFESLCAKTLSDGREPRSVGMAL